MQGGIAGGLGYALSPAVAALPALARIGSPLARSIIAGSVVGALSDIGAQVAGNVAFGDAWCHGVGEAAFSGLLAGGVGGGIGWITPRTLKIIGFRGVGTSPEKYLKHYGFQGDAILRHEHALIGAGHGGISFDKGKHIFGFFPSDTEMRTPDLGQRLTVRTPVIGQVRDDTWVFKRAHELAELTGWRTELREISITLPRGQVLSIQNQVLQDVRLGETRSPIQWYNWPPLDGSPMPSCWNNCLTWPHTLGIPIPESTGQLGRYIPLLPRLFEPPW